MDHLSAKKHDIDEVFGAIKEIHAKKPPSLLVNVQHQYLKPSLREYQKLGVLWMLEKERFGKDTEETKQRKKY